jgi:anaerobic dimethyl sulfoxide reductase subunit B (iron-sulfur subunit)
MRQVHFYFDATRCTGCGACGVACKDWNEVASGPQTQWRRVYSTEAGRFPSVDVVHLCMSCFHCAEPACAKACPTGAISKDPSTGAVLVDPDICMGCRECLKACPYGAPQYTPGDRRMSKCTFCGDRQAQGLKPACVDACPYFALDIGTAEELRSKHPDSVPLTAGTLPGIGAEHAATKPSVFVKPRPLRAQGATVMRKNGVAVEHLRPVPGPAEEVWRARAGEPFADKKPDKQC